MAVTQEITFIHEIHELKRKKSSRRKGIGGKLYGKILLLFSFTVDSINHSSLLIFSRISLKTSTFFFVSMINGL